VANIPTSAGTTGPTALPTGSRYAYLDRLQDKMEERLAHKVPAAGRFCGFCFGRLRPDDQVCPFCEHSLDRVGTTREIPQEVLRAYKAKQRTEATWVYGMGFVGLIIASFLFVVMVLWGPGPIGHPAVAFTMLIGGGYVLARFFGEVVGGTIGFPKAIRRRDALWDEWLKTHPDPVSRG
jgi:hypothetical protein